MHGETITKNSSSLFAIKHRHTMYSLKYLQHL